MFVVFNLIADWKAINDIFEISVQEMVAVLQDRWYEKRRKQIAFKIHAP